jgi:catecholate siderophore receptor
MNNTVPSETHQHRRLATVTALAVVHGLGASTAAGQETSAFATQTDDPPVTLPEYTVRDLAARQASSPKFTAPLLDTPQTLSVIPVEVFAQQGAQNLGDVLRNTPGITFLAGEGGNATSADGDSFFMRGFDTSNNVFVDGVRDAGQVARDVYNLEQVEIAKGPAGADVGRGATSGYVNLATKVARAGRLHQGTATYGSDDKKRVTLDVNEQVGPAAAIRLAAMWQDGGVAGRDVAKQNRWAVAPSFTLGLGARTRASVAFEHYEQDDLPDYGLPRGALPDGGGFDPAPPAVDQETFYGTIHDFDRAESDSVTVRVDHDLGGVHLSNQTRFKSVDRRAHVTAPTNYSATTGLVSRSRQGNQRENDTWSNLTNLRASFATGALRHNLSAGLEYLHEEQNTLAHSSQALPGTSLTNPDITSAVPDPVPTAWNEGKMETKALYAFDTVALDERWSLTGGFRIDDYDITAGTARDDDRLFSWKAGLVFKPRSNGSVYVGYGDSAQPPGSALSLSTGATNANNPALEPQEARNLEIGTKWSFFEGRLAATGALFETENDGIASTDTITGEVVQRNSQNVRGVELGVTGQITPNWLVFGSLALLDSEYSAPTAVSNAATDGAELQRTPKVSGSLWSTWRFDNGLTLGGGVQYTGETQRQTTNTPSANMPEVPDYFVADVVASYPVNDHLTLRLNVNNVFDEFYLRSLNNNGNRYNPGAPRSFLLSADVRF